MGFIKSSLALALASLLVACGGSGGDGYYNNADSKQNNDTTTPETATPIEIAKAELDILKREGQFLFGNYDPSDANSAKGYIDHALDTFAQGPLQLTLDIRKINLNNFSSHYRSKCFEKSTSDYRACYSFTGNEIKGLVNGYDNWDFDIIADDLKNIKLKSEDVSPNLEGYQAKTRIFIFENENGDKNFHDVTITGAFSYPFEQSWGLTQTSQKRFILINDATSDYKITVTTTTIDPVTNQPVEKEVTTGAFSTYKDLTSNDGELFMFESGSGFNVLINDNPNVSFAEPVSFILSSVPGDTNSSSSYRIRASGEQELILANVTAIDGTRVENETPSLNTQSLNGSIKLIGSNIFKFKLLQAGSLTFEHVINKISFKGTSTNNNKVITTSLTQPSGLKY